MTTDLVIRDEWYERLIDDCKTILTETEFTARWALVEGYHALGKRILEEEPHVVQGGSTLRELLHACETSLGKSEATLYRAVQFAQKYPDLSLLPEGKNTSWHVICSKYLPVHFLSESTEWYTPKDIIDKSQTVLGKIDLDPCADAGRNVPAALHYTEEDNGLAQEWRGSVYMNPPYGKAIQGWVEKLVEEYRNANVQQAIALVPARTDTAWFATFRDYAVCFIRGRLRFSGMENSAPFPSAVVYLGPDVARFAEVFQEAGDIWVRWKTD